MKHVDADLALAAMTRLWRSFGNEVSAPLLSSWRTMCDALNEAGQVPGWTALNMPTGTGKTQFAAQYCALLPYPIQPSSPLETTRHPGVLFVTRFVEEAERFVDQVNKLAGRKIAAAYYKGSPVSLPLARSYPVLAITHAACEQHQLNLKLGAHGESVWENLMRWHHGRRSKVIIDEIPNFITPVQINSHWLATTLGALKYLPDADPKLYFELDLLLTSVTNPAGPRKSRTLEFELIENINTRKIREHLNTVEDNALTITCSNETTSLRNVCQSTLSAIEAISANGWAWVSFRGRLAQLNSARLHPSLKDGSGVILDGTAALQPAYGLLSPPARVVSAPPNVRNYDNVTLYVASGQKAGKEYLTANAQKLWPQYRAALEAVIPNAERVLVVCHKGFREAVDVIPMRPYSFAHYGDIDGKNNWDSHEAVVILGLPYLEAATYPNIVQAILGQQTSDWLQVSELREMGPHGDILAALQRAHLSVGSVQAIHRSRCRKPVDSAGRCRPTSVFVALPSGQDGDAVLEAIKKSLPGAKVQTWEVNSTATKKKRTVPTSEALCNFFTTAPAGLYTKAQVRAATAVAPTSLDRAIQRMRTHTSQESRQLSELSVSYVQQYGKGAESYFLKA